MSMMHFTYYSICYFVSPSLKILYMSITSSTIGKRTFKVILLGDSSTGKTSIIERFVNNKF